MSRKWRFERHDEAVIRDLSQALRISPLLAQVLIGRGYHESDAAGRFLNSQLTDLHPPELLPGVAEAAERIVAAVKANRRITIYGDYDVDGMTSTSLLWHCLQLCGGNVDYYIPSRLDEGYGLNCDALRELHAEDPNRLVVSVDCGISSVEEAGLARELGLELIVTDHHQMTDELPEAAVLVHPRLPGGDYPFGGLCGAGVSFKLAWAVCRLLGDGKKASPKMREFLKGAVVLAAIGTVADVVPLVDENRAIVRYGLAGMNDFASVGLQALLRVSGLADRKQFAADDVGFAIGPRLNAAGRLGQARLAVELLTTSDAERARSLADYLDQLNKSRQTVERRIFKQAKEQVDAHPEWADQAALVLADSEWHAGVIGIVASRIAEHYHKPAFLISVDSSTATGQGSGRSQGIVDLHEALLACGDCLNGFGGHAAAAGLRIDEAKIGEFRDRFARFAAENPIPEGLDRELRIDAEVRLADVTHRAIKELDRLGPFGQENPHPVFSATHVELAQPAATMGEGGRHLNMHVKQFGTRIRAIAFGRGEWAEEINRLDRPFAISFAPILNEFRGRESVELKLMDWQPG